MNENLVRKDFYLIINCDNFPLNFFFSFKKKISSVFEFQIYYYLILIFFRGHSKQTSFEWRTTQKKIDRFPNETIGRKISYKLVCFDQKIGNLQSEYPFYPINHPIKFSKIFLIYSPARKTSPHPSHLDANCES